MSTYQFEEVAVPQGAFIGWADQPGQVITGKVLSYDPAGGQDFAGGICPQLVLELVETASSFSKNGTRSDFQSGDMVTITAGQANLKRGILAANPASGDVIRVTHSRNERTTNGTVKIFDIAIARGAGGGTPAGQQQAQTAPVAPF